MSSTEQLKTRPLEGVTILEMGQLLAGPFAGALMGWFGAEVIKVEPPVVGDPIRTWRKLHNGTSLWWYSLARNKKSITLDLRLPQARELARQLIGQVDAVIENFKPGTLERWGLGYEDLRAINPRLIMVRISGFGQSGPNRHKPGYASVCEGFGGLRYINGFPDRAPARANLSLGDSLTGVHAVLGLLTALYHRDVNGGTGQMVDVAIYESVFNLMESMVSEFDMYGVVRERQGTKLTGIVPSNTYECRDGKHIIIGANGDNLFKRLMRAIGRDDMADDARLADNAGRVAHEEEVDGAIRAWAREQTYEKAIAVVEAAGVPIGPIYSIADILRDPHYIARGMFEEARLPDGEQVKIPTFAPKLSATPGATEWIGPALGAHNKEVYCDRLGLSEAELAALQDAGVV